MLSVLLLGGTRAFAGDGKKGQGQNNQGNNNQGNNGGGLITWIDNLLTDIFGGNNSQGGNNNSQGGNYDGSGWANGGSTGGGGTAPIDGGIGLLLAAGVGLGIRKLARRS
jgi:hypothetical protein